MRLRIAYISLIMFAASVQSSAQLLPNLGGQRTGSSTLTFLKNDANPRSIGMGGANVTFKEDGYAAFMNPAATATLKGLDFSTSNYFHGVGIQQTFLATNTSFFWKRLCLQFIRKQYSFWQTGGTNRISTPGHRRVFLCCQYRHRFWVCQKTIRPILIWVKL